MGKQITPTEATTLCDSFDAKYAELTKFIGKDDNRSVLFSLSELKTYFDYLEQSPGDIDGIRIYLGSHKSDNLTTVFLAPTAKGTDNTKLNAFDYGGSGDPLNKKYGQ